MKFIHVANIRLGIMPDREKTWQQDRGKEIYEEFFRLITYAKENFIDLILISGNLFDYIPGDDELKLLDDWIKELNDTLVIYQPGYKDLMSPGSALDTFSFDSNIYVIGREHNKTGMQKDYKFYCESSRDGAFHKLSFPNWKEKPLNIYGFAPLAEKESVPDAYYIKPDKDYTNILMLPHAKERLRNRCYDYIASGQGHSYQMIVRNQIYASGALIPVSSEETGKHGFIEGMLPEMPDQRKQIRFINFARRQYKTINYPVNRYMTAMEIAEDLIHLMKKEGSDNIYTINLIRNESCEKSFEIEKYFGFEKLYILEINGEHYDRESYEKYMWANKNTAFGSLLNKLYTSDPLKRDGAKLAVEQIIEKSGVNKRKSDKVYDKTYAEARKQSLNTLAAMKKELFASPEIKEYQDVKEQLDAGKEVDMHLTEMVAAEHKQEMQLAIEKSNISLIPEKYNRKWRRNGIRIAIIPFILFIFVCISWLPPVIKVWLGSYPDFGMVWGLLIAMCLIVLFFYLLGYYTSKLRDTRYEDRGFKGEMNSARKKITEADIKLSEIRKERKKYQLLQNRNKVLQKSLNQDDVSGKKIIYQIKIIEEAMTALEED